MFFFFFFHTKTGSTYHSIDTTRLAESTYTQYSVWHETVHDTGEISAQYANIQVRQSSARETKEPHHH
jgi:hypothetical protein